MMTQHQVAEAIAKLDEKSLTQDLLIPLVQLIHPGRTEYTHSATEAGRDVVSFGKDSLGRHHLVLVQAKSAKVSFGAEKFGGLYQTALIARKQGITTESGQKLIPHEVWLMVPFPFPENERRQVADVLSEMERESIKLIAGDELCCLIAEKIPEAASQYLSEDGNRTAALAAKLGLHSESRAFGLSADRKISDFYVSTHLAPEAHLTRDVLDGLIEVTDFEETLNFKAQELQPRTDEEMLTSQLPKPLLTFVSRSSRLRSLASEYDMRVVFRLPQRQTTVPRYTLSWSLSGCLDSELNQLEMAIRECPKVLDTSPIKIRRVCELFGKTERLLRHADIDLGCVTNVEIPQQSETIANIERTLERIQGGGRPDQEQQGQLDTLVRVAVPNPIHILELGRVVLVEGGPGYGKTTLLRTLGTSLIAAGRRMAFVFCHSIDPKLARSTLSEIVRKCDAGNQYREGVPKDTILILDGLDECPFDLSDKILRPSDHFASIVVSCRTAFDTELREQCLHVGVAPFSSEDRRNFFRKWFAGDQALQEKAHQLISKYPDIDEHTHLPLVATILAALIERQHEPKTRAEIYSQRLDLLLERWDKARGVQRLEVNEPDVKRRFLQQLAFNIHDLDDRTRLFPLDQIELAYETSLGGRGYKLRFEDVLQDLIVGNGLLIQERKGVFSLGHLSFQEHLAGEFLARTKTVSQLSEYLADDWWNEPLNFWASIKGDLTEFIEQLVSEDALESHALQIAEMLRYAPYTSPGARDSTLDLAKWAGHRAMRE
ncbi:MAG: NACHT domain-containing protein [Verrucomicrobiota bacterium]